MNRRVAASCCAAALGAGVTPLLLQAQGRTNPDLEGRSALHAAGAVVAHGSALAEVWPGFWTVDQPFILVDSTQTVLFIGQHTVPTGYSRASGTDGRLWVYAGVPQDLSIARGDLVELRYEVAGRQITAARLTSNEKGALQLLFHEAFHVYQDRFAPTRPYRGDGQPAPKVTDVSDAATIERAVLRCAVLAADKKSAVRLGKRYLALRHLRMAGEPDSIRESEHRVERVEGSALWVELRMIGEIEGTSSDNQFRRSVADALLWKIPERPNFFADGLPMARRQSLYATGAAMLTLIDWLGKSTWRSAVEQGEPILGVLNDVLGGSASRGIDKDVTSANGHELRSAPCSAIGG